MIHSVAGKLLLKKDNFLIVEAGPIAFKIFAAASVLANLPSPGSQVKIFCYLHVREDALELYGFLSEKELELFEKLNSISGIGPKSALGVLSIAKIDQLIAAINEGKTELLTRASGIGRKTAERIVLELKGKLDLIRAPQALSLMESDLELEETLVSLGYSKNQAKTAIAKIDPKITNFKDRLKAALKSAKPGQ